MKLKNEKFDLDTIVKQSIQKTLKNNYQISNEDFDELPLNEAYVVPVKAFNSDTSSISASSFKDHKDLYEKYVKELNEISIKLDTESARTGESDSNNSVFRDLKINESFNANGAYLHELYFNNCFCKNSKVYVDSISYMKIEKDFGEFDSWQKDFIGCALASREGWVVTGYNLYLKKYVNTVIDSHSNNVMIGLIPLIVVDMWSHTYNKDYGINKKKYVESQMREFNWDVIENRFKKVERIIEASK